MEEERNIKALKIAALHYWQQIKKDWKLSIPGLLLPGIGSILVFYTPSLIVGKLLGKYAGQGLPTIGEIAPYLFAFGGIWLIGEIIWRVAIHMLIQVEVRGIERLYIQAMNYMLEKDLAFFHNNFAGSLTKKTAGYAKNYENFMDVLSFNVAANIIPLGFISYVLWQYSPYLVFTLIGLVTLTIIIIIPLIRKRRSLVVVRESASNSVSGYVADIYGNIDAVRAFAQEKFEALSHSRHANDYMRKARRSWDYQNQRIDVLISPMYVLTNLSGLIVALMVARNNGVGIEVVFVTFSFYAGFTRIMWEFNNIYRRIETAISEAGQFTELLLEEPLLKDPAHPKKFSVSSGEIEFQNVSFRYHDNDTEQLFESLNLIIKPGEKIGLVGHSGGGKTTITRLLLRFMDIDRGEILIDGQNIAQIAQNDLRKHIAYVPQDPVMFHRSLADNIRYGELDASFSQIKKAAKDAHATEFIDHLAKKYETLVGERGVKLSGGQRQRIAIARAMLKNAPILLLDEATSALDSESERYIQDALWKLMEGKTAIVIAHRLSTIQKMDRIIVLENGQIVEEGSHKELLKNNGIYSELWKHQSGGFLEE